MKHSSGAYALLIGWLAYELKSVPFKLTHDPNLTDVSKPVPSNAHSFRIGSSNRSVLMHTPADGVYDGPVERGNIVRVAAGNELAVGHDFLIHPGCSGILQIRLQRKP